MRYMSFFQLALSEFLFNPFRIIHLSSLWSGNCTPLIWNPSFLGLLHESQLSLVWFLTLASVGRREKADEGGAGLCTKLVFGVLLASFALTATLYLTDYQQGQLAKLTASLPPEVQQLASKADQALADLTKNLQRIAANGVDKAEELAEKVPVGDKTLADYVFSSKRKVSRYF